MNAPNEFKPMSVYQAINRVQSELSKVGIAKDRRNTQGSGYNFRGIDDVYNVLSGLLAAHGLCILPRMVSRSCEERTSKNGGALFYVTVEAEFDFVSAADGSKHTVKTFGEAMDSGDKATNKAMSAAYKYAAFQAFSIPTQGDNDADAHTHEVASKPASSKSVAAATLETMSDEEKQFLKEQAMEVVGLLPDELAAWTRYNEIKNTLDADEQVALWAFIDSKTRAMLKKGKDLELAGQA